MATRSVLLVVAPDQRGLVAAVAEAIGAVGGNIVDADQHTDADAALFLQRVDFETAEGAAEHFAVRFADTAKRLDLRWELYDAARPRRLALVASRELHCLYDVLARCAAGELDATVGVVASNHVSTAEVAARFEVPFVHIGGVDRGEREAVLAGAVEEAGADVIVLARYMQILSAELCAEWAGRAINIHHSFLPAFAGARPYHQAHRRGVKLIGATAHYVTADLDAGPIIVQDVTPVSHRDDVYRLRRRGADLERVVLARAIGLHLEHRVLAYGNRTVVFD